MSKHFSEYTEKTPNGKLKYECYHLTKNGLKKPHSVKYDDVIKYWFECDDCHTDFKLSILKITEDDRWCPCCDSIICNLWYMSYAICGCISIIC
jgi:hypothetical protein